MPRRRRRQHKLLWGVLAGFMIVVFMLPLLQYVLTLPPPGGRFHYEVYGPPTLDVLAVAHNLTRLYGKGNVVVNVTTNYEEFSSYAAALLKLMPPGLILALEAQAYYPPIVVVYDEHGPRSVFPAVSASRSFLLNVARYVDAARGLVCKYEAKGLVCRKNATLVAEVAALLREKRCHVRVVYWSNESLASSCAVRMSEDEYHKLLEALNVTASRLYLFCGRGVVAVASNSSLPPTLAWQAITSVLASNNTYVVGYSNNKLTKLAATNTEMLREVCQQG